MTCTLCNELIAPGDVEMHHPVYKSHGGSQVVPTHRACHVAHHSTIGDFKAWGSIGGQISALSKRWAFNLKHVRAHPAHDINRAFYTAHYAH
ncbi:MAG: hypothetical protein L0229_00220 [Blastocatellia bacterium]|nr:hypothetical protein [Blastocatellia bacterium]